MDTNGEGNQQGRQPDSTTLSVISACIVAPSGSVPLNTRECYGINNVVEVCDQRLGDGERLQTATTVHAAGGTKVSGGTNADFLARRLTIRLLNAAAARPWPRQCGHQVWPTPRYGLYAVP